MTAHDLLGYSVFGGQVSDCAQAMLDAAKDGAREGRVMACLNPHSFAVARGDRTFQTALHGADWLVPDGSGVVLAAKILGVPLAGRVAGPDVFKTVLRIQNETGGSVFFLGASEETLTKIAERMGREFPNVTVAGTFSPPFKPTFSDLDNDAMLSAINAASPDILWVAMTAPKQEKWITMHRGRLDVGAIGAVGAAFDFFAGNVQRSHPIFRKLGLEWLPRLIRQPRRLWRRTVLSVPVFMFEVIRARLRTVLRKHEPTT